jgi:hypothetical protein
MVVRTLYAMIKIGSLVYRNSGPGIGSGELDVDSNFLNLGRWAIEKLSRVLAVDGENVLLEHLKTGKHYSVPSNILNVIE